MGLARAPRLGEPPDGSATPAATTEAPAAAGPLAAGATATSAAASGLPSPAGRDARSNSGLPSRPDVASAPPPSSAGALLPPRPAGATPQSRNGALSTSRFTSIEEIWGQRTAAGTVVSIVTNGVVPIDAFSHFRLEGERPREVIRLRGVDDSYRRSTISVATGEVKQVRLGYHAKPGGNELHIVVDVNSPRVKLIRATPIDNRIELLFAVQ